jgi:hypothetical protein
MIDIAETFRRMSRSRETVTLRLDALYYRAAKASLRSIESGMKKVDQAQKRFDALKAKEERILTKHERKRQHIEDSRPDREYNVHAEAYDELEPIYIQMNDADYQLSEAYEPVVYHAAMAHVLGAAALESHINRVASELLTGQMLEEFDRLSLTGKFLYLPSLMGFPSFNRAIEPYQSFHALVRLRNRLIHYKEKEEDWSGSLVPGFLEDLGLTYEAAKKSVIAARGMIVRLAEIIGSESPSWLDLDVARHFEFTIRHDK